MIRTVKAWLLRGLGPKGYGRVKQTLDRFVFRYRRRAYSQFGEDLFLSAYFGDQAQGTYVDVGAFHPRQFSNTQLLYERGWRGLNVDPTPGSMRLFAAIRPGDVNLELAISDQPGPHALHSWGLHAENSLAPDQVRAAEEQLGAAHDVVPVEARTLTQVLDENGFRTRRIDLLTVDAEGHDLAVLRSLDWGRYRPRLVVTELFASDLEALLASDQYAFMSKQGYRLVAWQRPSVIFEAEPEAGGAE